MGGIRQALSGRTAAILASGNSSLGARLVANAFFLRHFLPALPGRLRQQGFAALGAWNAERNALVRHRVTPHEMRYFADDLVHVMALRDQLVLQLDLQALHRREAGQRVAALARKSALAEAARKHDLAHPVTLPVPIDRQDCAADAIAALDGPLVVKPDRGRRARGVALLVPRRQGQWELIDRAGSTSGSLASLLQAHCPGEALVVQPLLRNHPAIAAVVGAVPLTLRMVTGCCAGRAQTLSILAEIPLDSRLPLPGAQMILPVDRDTGRLADPGPKSGNNGFHPLTGCKLAGLDLPFFAAVRLCAERAHAAIAPRRTMLGWDMAISPEGPVLIEANVNWGVAVHCRNAAGFDAEPARRFARCIQGIFA